MSKRFRKIVHVVVVMTMVFSTFGGQAYAATNHDVKAVFSVDSGGPQLVGLELLDMEGMTTRELSPQVPYQLRISLQHDETLDRIANIKAVFYHSSEQAVPIQGNDTTVAAYEWTKGGNFTKDSTTGRTWTVEQGTGAPDLTKESGDFNLVFKPGKAARQTGENDRWNVYVRVTDVYGKTAEGTIQDITMSWYGEINVIPKDVDFGTLLHNETHLDAPTPVTVNTIANGESSLLGRASETWNGDNGLLVPYDPNLKGNPSVRITTTQDSGEETVLRTNDTAIKGKESISSTNESGLNTVLALGLDTNGWIERGTYLGKLIFTIAQQVPGDSGSNEGDQDAGGGETSQSEPIPGYYLAFRDDFSNPEPFADTVGWQYSPYPIGPGPTYTANGTLRFSLPAGRQGNGGLNYILDGGLGPADNGDHVIIRMRVRGDSYPFDLDSSRNRLTISGRSLDSIGSEWQVVTFQRSEYDLECNNQIRCVLQITWSSSGDLPFDVEIDYIEVWSPRDTSIPENYRLLYHQGFLYTSKTSPPNDWLLIEIPNNWGYWSKFNLGALELDYISNQRFMMKRPFSPADFSSGGPIYIKVAGRAWNYAYTGSEYLKVANQVIRPPLNGKAIVTVEPQDMGCYDDSNDCALVLDVKADGSYPSPRFLIDYIQVWVPDNNK